MDIERVRAEEAASKTKDGEGLRPGRLLTRYPDLLE